MKSIYILLFIAAGLCSCKKKQHSCRCATTVYYQTSQWQYLSTTRPMSEKMTKKQAQAVCDNEKLNIEASYDNYITNNGSSSNNSVTHSTNCTLE